MHLCYRLPIIDVAQKQSGSDHISQRSSALFNRLFYDFETSPGLCGGITATYRFPVPADRCRARDEEMVANPHRARKTDLFFEPAG